jgi:hypothetical protein
MRFQTKEGKIFNAVSFNRFISKMEQGTLYIAKVILDNETWIVNSNEDKNDLRSKAISFVKKFKQPVKICRVDRFIDEYESNELYSLSYEDCLAK